MEKGGISITLSNKITISRIVVIPFFMIFAFPWPSFFGFAIPYAVRVIASLALFVLASISDAVDGKIARKFNQITDFGKFLDPIADKLLVTAALLALCAERPLYVWATAIILMREFIVTGLRLVAAAGGRVIAAGKLGKAKTTLQTTSIIILYSAKVLGLIYGPLEKYLVILGDVVMLAAVVMTIISGVEYILRNKDVLRGSI